MEERTTSVGRRWPKEYRSLGTMYCRSAERSSLFSLFGKSEPSSGTSRSVALLYPSAVAAAAAAAAAAPGLESEAAPWNAGTGLDPASSQPAGGRSP